MHGMDDQKKYEKSHFFNTLDPFDQFFIMEIKKNCDKVLFNDTFEFLCIEFHRLAPEV